jgi:hypothetical protein
MTPAFKGNLGAWHSCGGYSDKPEKVRHFSAVLKLPVVAHFYSGTGHKAKPFPRK